MPLSELMVEWSSPVFTSHLILNWPLINGKPIMSTLWYVSPQNMNAEILGCNHVGSRSILNTWILWVTGYNGVNCHSFIEVSSVSYFITWQFVNSLNTQTASMPPSLQIQQKSNTNLFVHSESKCFLVWPAIKSLLNYVFIENSLHA